MKERDIMIGLTYVTDRRTNNKENQILVKLLPESFLPATGREETLRKLVTN